MRKGEGDPPVSKVGNPSNWPLNAWQCLMHSKDFDAICDKFKPRFVDAGNGIQMCRSMSFGHINNKPNTMPEALRAGFALHSYPPSKFKWQIVSDLIWRDSTPPA